MLLMNMLMSTTSMHELLPLAQENLRWIRSLVALQALIIQLVTLWADFGLFVFCEIGTFSGYPKLSEVLARSCQPYLRNTVRGEVIQILMTHGRGEGGIFYSWSRMIQWTMMMTLMKIMIKMMTIAKIMSVSGRGCQQRLSGKKSRDKLEHSSHRYPKHIIIFSCPGSSIPDLGHWVTDWLTATLEFRHNEWLSRL